VCKAKKLKAVGFPILYMLAGFLQSTKLIANSGFEGFGRKVYPMTIYTYKLNIVNKCLRCSTIILVYLLDHFAKRP
jgi:hypothetical protein